ncbi:hypothetical protein AWB69_05499 [Caballeronia udeis]|uniref:Uncharacterized protein n=1 Tax=Caballeronia udeis TaxID=1232866 RepID=A0A158I9S2_9BURK|nr:hypothetical protein AWB69_05499 [Caballeronia udeis]
MPCKWYHPILQFRVLASKLHPIPQGFSKSAYCASIRSRVAK